MENVCTRINIGILNPTVNEFGTRFVGPTFRKAQNSSPKRKLEGNATVNTRHSRRGPNFQQGSLAPDPSDKYLDLKGSRGGRTVALAPSPGRKQNAISIALPKVVEM